MSFIFSVFPLTLHGFQENQVVATIDGNPLYSGEFLYAYNKNRDLSQPIRSDSLFSYLDQYLTFKLKVLAAKQAGIDTTAKFQQEYLAYTRGIRKPYIQSENLIKDLSIEAYDRLQYEVRASHILVRIPDNASPRDTLIAYEKISFLKEQAEAGVDFAELARKNSEDGSARNGGDLGFFTGFSMVYPFESAAYETAIGKISGITRTQFGYHLLKVTDKRAARGRVKTSHIFINTSNRNTAQATSLINMVYDSLKNGADWRALCASYSDDSRTKLSGGSLPFYGVTQFPEPLLNAAFELKEPGDYSKPVKSRFGWHILKLEAKEPIKSFEELQPTLYARIQRSGRNQLDKKGIIKKLKAENGFRQDTSQINRITNSIVASDSIFPEPELAILFEIGTKKITNQDFIGYIKTRYTQLSNYPKDQVWKDYENFEYEGIIAFEEGLIPQKYPEHQYLVDEYRDGLMLFEIMETKIWNAAIEDSIGLANFYEQNKKMYSAPERAIVHTVESDSSLLLQKADSLLRRVSNISEPRTFLRDTMSKEDFSLLKIVKRSVEGEDLSIFAGINWESGTTVLNTEAGKLYWVERKLSQGYYELDEIMGLVISDYQDDLEKKWVEKLKSQHKIKINKKVIRSLSEN